MLYFMHMSRKFWKSSYEELRSICRFRVMESIWDNMIIDAESGLLGKLNSKKNIFIYGAFRLDSFSEIDKKRYLESIYEQARKEAALAKGKRIIIEVFDVNSKSGHSSKDIEVYLGNRLEKEGFAVDIKRPEMLIPVILFNWRCYSGIAAYSQKSRKSLNPIRHYNFSRNGISRSEMKIEEAFDRFGIRARGVAIDLGAAPGGWSAFLAKRGFAVIAVDSALLNAGKLAAVRIPVLDSSTAKAPKKGSVLHYRMGFAEARKMLKNTRAALLVDDMNISPAESAKAIVSYAGLLKENGACIMTVKSVTKYVPRHLSSVKKTFGVKMQIERIAVLPSNRQELTILCRKRAYSIEN